MDYAGPRRNTWQTASGLGAVLALHAALIYGLLNGLDVAFMGQKPPPPLLTHLLADPPTPPPPPQFAPDLPAPSIFVPQLEVPSVLPPPNRAPASVTHTLAPPVPPAVVGKVAPPADTGFSPSAIRGGAPAPAYPEAYQQDARAGRVTVACTIEVTGVPTRCRVVSATGGPAFAAETLRWLTGPDHPLYRPAMENGRPRREDHQWVVRFDPPFSDLP